MNIQYYNGKNMLWLEPSQKYELNTEFLIDAWKEAQKSNSEIFFTWAINRFKKLFNLQKITIFLGTNGFKKICGDDFLTLKNYFRLSQKVQHIIASNDISTDPRNKNKSLTGKCLQYPFILGTEVCGSIVYYRRSDIENFTQDEICTITGPYSKYISEILMDWNNKNIKFGSEMWDFINIMSHEIRTPLNGISGMIQLLMDTGSNLTQAQWKYVHILQDSNILLLNLINDMIDYSKLQYKNINIKKESFSLSSLVTQAKNILAEKINHNLTITHNKQNYDLLVGDKAKILQIFVNTLSNALKFTPEKGNISITTDIVFPKDGMSILEYIIIDNGSGIPEENLKKIYEPFFKGDNNKMMKPTTKGFAGLETKWVILLIAIVLMLAVVAMMLISYISTL